MKLVKIKPTGIRITITDDHDESYLIETARQLIQKTGDQYGVIDNLGFFVWPDKIAQAHIPPDRYGPAIPDRYGSVEH